VSYKKYLIYSTFSFVLFVLFHVCLFSISNETGKFLPIGALKGLGIVFFVFLLMNVYNGKEFFEVHINDNKLNFSSCFIYAFVYPCVFIYILYQHYYFLKIQRHIKENFSKEKLLISILDTDDGKFPITVNIDNLKITRDLLAYYEVKNKEDCYIKMVNNFLKRNGFGKVCSFNIKKTTQTILPKNPFLNDKCETSSELEIIIKKVQMGEKL